MLVALAWAGREVTAPFAVTFGDVPPGELVGYTDSAGLVSIAVNGGDAARRLRLRPGTSVTLRVAKLSIRAGVPFPAGT